MFCDVLGAPTGLLIEVDCGRVIVCTSSMLSWASKRLVFLFSWVESAPRRSSSEETFAYSVEAESCLALDYASC